jgi:hypothetical protein
MMNTGSFGFFELYNHYRSIKSKVDRHSTDIPPNFYSLEDHAVCCLKALWDSRAAILDTGAYLAMSGLDEHAVASAELVEYPLGESIRFFDAWTMTKLKYRSDIFSVGWKDRDKECLANGGASMSHAVRVANVQLASHVNPDRFHPSHLKQRRLDIITEAALHTHNLLERHVDPRSLSERGPSTFPTTSRLNRMQWTSRVKNTHTLEGSEPTHLL